MPLSCWIGAGTEAWAGRKAGPRQTSSGHEVAALELVSTLHVDLEIGLGVAVHVAFDHRVGLAVRAIGGSRRADGDREVPPFTRVKAWLPATDPVGVDAAEIDLVARLEAHDRVAVSIGGREELETYRLLRRRRSR